MDLKSINVLLADVPWKYQNFSEKKNGSTKPHYESMTVEEAAALPVHKIGGKNAALLFWITGVKLAEGAHIPIFEAWNFRPVTTIFVWRKIYKSGKPYTGLGFWSRSATEMCLLGIRGKVSRKKSATNVLQVIEAPVRRHSQKPDEQYERIGELFEGNCCELFARAYRPGWLSLGYELSGMKLDEEIEYLLGQSEIGGI